MRKGIFILMLLIFAAGVSSFAVNPRDLKFAPLKFEPPEPTRYVAENGMVVYFLADHQLPIITCAAFFKGGTVFDPSEMIGLTEMTAKLLRTGGAGKRTPDQVDQDLDFVGASISSAAGSDNLMLDLRSLKKDADLGLEIFSDILQKPTFDTSKISMELSNKSDEIRRQNDEPNAVTRRIYYQEVYSGHPYGNFATLASIGKINKDALVAQYKKFYNPDNCILAISGDLTTDEVKRSGR